MSAITLQWVLSPDNIKGPKMGVFVLHHLDPTVGAIALLQQ